MTTRSARLFIELATLSGCVSVSRLERMKSMQLFMVEKTQQAVLALEAARVRAPRERTLLALALLVARVQVNHLVKPVPSVRAAAHRLRSETERRAAQLAAEQVTRYEAEPRSEQSSSELYQTLRACRGVFPREAAVLRRALGTEWVDADDLQRASRES
jgi:hypothetical protein